MNKFLTQKFSNLKLKNDNYSPLKEDGDISVSENTPKKFTPSRSNCKIFCVGRKLFQNNKSFKIHKRNKEHKSKKDRLRTLFQEIQNKMQSLKTDISAGLQNYHRDSKTPNCVTPNRKIRRILGRTPTKLYSPFSIETPPPSFHWRREFPDNVESTPVTLSEWRSSPHCNCAHKSKKSLANILYD